MTVKEAIARVDLDAFADALAPDVVWIGLWPGELCRNRDDVLEMFARMREHDVQIRPEIVLEREGVLVVDAHLNGLHHVVVSRDDGLVSEVRVYSDRNAALAAVEAVDW